MAYSETSFMEGVIAGIITGAGAGVVASPATAGLSIPILTMIGAVIGALIKIQLFQAILAIVGIYIFGKLNIFPSYMIIVFIAVMAIWILKGKK